jgi:hypothetical protein
MPWLVILLFGALFVLGGFTVWGVFIEGWGVKQVPPPQPVPGLHRQMALARELSI